MRLNSSHWSLGGAWAMALMAPSDAFSIHKIPATRQASPLRYADHDVHELGLSDFVGPRRQPWIEAMDLNGDGKVDLQDVAVLFDQVLPDKEIAKASVAALMMTCVLSMSPDMALVKGGGSSSRASSSYRSSSSSSYRSSPSRSSSSSSSSSSSYRSSPSRSSPSRSSPSRSSSYSSSPSRNIPSRSSYSSSAPSSSSYRSSPSRSTSRSSSSRSTTRGSGSGSYKSSPSSSAASNSSFKINPSRSSYSSTPPSSSTSSSSSQGIPTTSTTGSDPSRPGQSNPSSASHPNTSQSIPSRSSSTSSINRSNRSTSGSSSSSSSSSRDSKISPVESHSSSTSSQTSAASKVSSTQGQINPSTAVVTPSKSSTTNESVSPAKNSSPMSSVPKSNIFSAKSGRISKRRNAGAKNRKVSGSRRSGTKSRAKKGNISMRRQSTRKERKKPSAKRSKNGSNGKPGRISMRSRSSRKEEAKPGPPTSDTPIAKDSYTATIQTKDALPEPTSSPLTPLERSSGRISMRRRPSRKEVIYVQPQPAPVIQTQSQNNINIINSDNGFNGFDGGGYSENMGGYDPPPTVYQPQDYRPSPRPQYFPPYKRSSHASSTRGGSICVDLPQNGEVVDILADTQNGWYESSIVSNIDENNCRFDASPISDRALHKTMQTRRENHMIRNGVLEFAGLASLGIAVDAWTSQREKSFENAYLEAMNNNPALQRLSKRYFGVTPNRPLKRMPAESKPSSAKYNGFTNESDGTEQVVSATLNFEASGEISGNGYDSEDGQYDIPGEWGGDNELRWVEQYSSSDLCVVVNGKFSQDWKGGTSLDCRFASTEDIDGSFTLWD